MTHTPGPWVETSLNGWDAVKPAKGNLAVCQLVENNPANARLIAAAPELLEALSLAATALTYSKPIMSHYPEPVQRHIEALAKAREIIAKATGKDAA